MPSRDYRRAVVSGREAALLAVFAEVARQGSFSAAARALGVSKSVVSEQVRALEERLGVRLLERTTRAVHVTELGRVVLTTAENVERELRDLSAQLDEDCSAPRGTLRIATTYDLGHLLVAPVVARLARRHPLLTFDIVADDAPRELIEGGFDVAVRLGAPRDSRLTARRLVDVEEPILAAPELAARWSRAARPSELADAPWVRHSLVGADTLAFVGPDDATDSLTPRISAQASTGWVLRSLLLGGAGLGVLPSYMVGDDVAEGRLVRLCPGWSWKTVTLYALFPGARHRRRSMEVFLGELKDTVLGARARWGAAREER